MSSRTDLLLDSSSASYRPISFFEKYSFYFISFQLQILNMVDIIYGLASLSFFVYIITLLHNEAFLNGIDS